MRSMEAPGRKHRCFTNHYRFMAFSEFVVEEHGLAVVKRLEVEVGVADRIDAGFGQFAHEACELAGELNRC